MKTIMATTAKAATAEISDATEPMMFPELLSESPTGLSAAFADPPTIGDPHALQNDDPSGFSFPHLGQYMLSEPRDDQYRVICIRTLSPSCSTKVFSAMWLLPSESVPITVKRIVSLLLNMLK